MNTIKGVAIWPTQEEIAIFLKEEAEKKKTRQ
jgi:hypothetical protein